MTLKHEKHPPTLLIDGDVLAYKAAAAANRSFSFDGDNHIAVGSMEEAKVIVEDTLASYLTGFKTTRYIVAMTDSANWRTAIYPPYKAHRKDKEKPACLRQIREYIMSAHQSMLRPTLEADDILGILATSTRIVKHPGEKIIISVDKDLKSIPGLFYDLTIGEVLEISEQEADRFHMVQTLIGDTADGYPGCPRIGPVKAGRVLDEKGSYSQWWPVVVEQYEKSGLTEKDALVQARVARICRVSDYNYSEKKVKVWNPPRL